MKTSILRKTILKLLKTEHARNIRTLAERVHPADMATALSVMSAENTKQFFDHINDNKIAAKIISAIKDKPTISKAINVLKKERLTEILGIMNPDDCADIIGSLPSKDADAVLKLLKKETASILNNLLKYAPDTSGGIMSTKYILMDKDETVSQAIKELKSKGHTDSYVKIYLKNKKEEVCGSAPISHIMTYPADTILSKIMDNNIVTIDIDVHQSKAISIFNRYRLIEAPVVDSEKRMLGLISADDIAYITEEEISKDVQEISGSLSIKNPIKARSIMTLISLVLMLTSSYIISINISFLDPQIVELLSSFPVLVILPALIAFQASSSTSRDFDIGLLEITDIMEIVKLEFKIGAIFGLLCSAIFGTILFFYTEGNIKDHLVVTIVMLANIVIGSIVGGSIPFIFRKKSKSYLPVSAPIIIGISVIIASAVYISLSKYLLSVDIIPNSWNLF